MLYAMLTCIHYKRTNWIYALTDKYKRAEELPSPKLIFVGGSSLAFGIDSKTIQDSLHLPVVNMGIHADLGISFQLSETDMLARKGDIVVWSFEYYPNDEEAINGDDNVKIIAYDALPEIYNYITWYKKLEFLKLKFFYFPRMGSKQLPSWLSVFRQQNVMSIDTAVFSYNRKAFNSYGDIRNQLCRKDNVSVLNFKLKQGYTEEAALMNEYADKLTARGVKVLFFFPCIMHTYYSGNKPGFDTIQSGYEKMLKVPVLNKISEVVYPDSMFYDQIYHLNKFGRKVYTRLMLTKLKSALN